MLFAVPGAFTPTCSDHHLPGFVMRAEDLKAKGADQIVCVSVNDPFVMGAWGKDQNVGSSVVMLADGNGEFTEAMGLTMDGSGFGLGPLRSQRYAAIIEDGDRDLAGRRARTGTHGQLGRRGARGAVALARARSAGPDPSRRSGQRSHADPCPTPS